MCKDYRIANSYDPIVLIEQARDRSQDTISQDKIDKPVQPSTPSEPMPSTPEDTAPSPSEPTAPQTTHHKQFLDIKAIPKHKLSRQAAEFLSERDIQIIASTPSRITTGESGSLSFYITKLGNPRQNFVGALPVTISLISPNSRVQLDKQTLGYIRDGKVDIHYSAQDRGAASVSISIDGQTLAVMPLTIVD